MCKYWIVRKTGILDLQREQYWIVKEMGVLDCQRDGYTGLAQRGVIWIGQVIGILD